jgi:hypothetical protein
LRLASLVAEDKINTKLTVQNCAADFLGYDTVSPALQMQEWTKGDFEWDDGRENKLYQIKSPNGLCVGTAVTEFCTNNDNMCIQWANKGDCRMSTSELSDAQVTTVRKSCPLACGLCDDNIDRDLR